MVKVYFSKNNISALAEKILAKFSAKTAIKVHFGEPGNVTFLDPKIAKAVYQKIKKFDPGTTLVECNVLYKSPRAETKSHLKVAKDHGFGFAPIDICDTNGDWIVPVNLKHFDKVKLGAGLKKYKNLVAVSHFKGHGASGFGGVLKNIGMGLGSRAGKMAMHKAFKLKVNEEKCLTCGICAKNCPVEAITLSNVAKINLKKCIGCAACVTNCPEGAINLPWGAQSSAELQEKIVEYVYGVLKNLKPAGFFNVLKNITANCDCAGIKMKKEVSDIGILASTDPVAIDQASFDLLNNACNEDLFKKLHGVDATVQLIYAEKLGLGSRKYELIDLNI